VFGFYLHFINKKTQKIESHWRNCFLRGFFILNNCNHLVANLYAVYRTGVCWETDSTCCLYCDGAYASLLSPSLRMVRHVHHNNYYQHQNKNLFGNLFPRKFHFWYSNFFLSKLLFFKPRLCAFFSQYYK